MPTPRIVIATTATVAALLIGGTAIATAATADTSSTATPRPVAVQDGSSTTTVPTTVPVTTQAGSTRVGEISRDEAVAIALAHMGTGRVTEIEREFEHGRLEWKVEIVGRTGEHDVRVDATTGAITRVDADDRRDDDRGSDDRDRDDRGWDDRSWDDRSWDDRSWDDRSWDDRSWDDRSWDDRSW
ncbi:PepSY domain-containing protein, partial [Pseudonocardia alaniniphila]